MPTTKPAPKEITLEVLRDYEGTLFVRNDSMQTVTCNSLDKSVPPFILGPKDSNESVAVLPKHIASEPGIQRLWLRKLIFISTDPDMQEQLILQANAQTLRRQDDDEQLQAQVEAPSSARSMVEKQCLITGERIFMSEKEVKDGVPPLAERYKDRAHEFVSSEVFENGETHLKWSHPSGPIKA